MLAIRSLLTGALSYEIIRGMKKLILCLIGLGIIGLAVFLYFRSPSLAFFNRLANTAAITPSTLSGNIPYTGSPLTKEYTNNTYRFSLSMPEDFSAQELPATDSGGMTVVLQDSKGNGIQILVTPYPDDLRSLTADDVRADIPDMKVTDEQSVEIGPDNTGVAFKSDNDAFGGASREVWFVFRGNLYQISTYARLDSLLQTMFGTWKFF